MLRQGVIGSTAFGSEGKMDKSQKLSSGEEKHSALFAWGITLLALFAIMSVFVYVSLSDDPRVLPGMIIVLILLDFGLLFANRKTLSAADVGFDLAHLSTLLSLLWGVVYGVGTISWRTTPVMIVTTIFYRPKFLERGNRRVAFVLSVIILVAVVPVAFGLVEHEAAISALSALYAILVALLWVCCSRLTTKVTAPASRAGAPPRGH